MATRLGAAAYDPVVLAHKFVGRAREARPQANDRAVSAAPDAAAAARQPADLPAVEQLLQLLGRAVRQFHTYPATSPLCAEAIAASHAALASIQHRDRIVLRVTLHDLLFDEMALGAGTIVEQELVRRLHRGRVAALTIERAASARDLSRFCADLVSLHESRDGNAALADLLVEHGVDTIDARAACRPEIVDLGAPAAPLCDLVASERSRADAAAVASGPAAHLYPPDKGWIRLDPSVSFTTVSLTDLAILAGDPADFAAVLLRLTDDQAAGAGLHALEAKFSDVAMLFASLDPRLARLMFAKLAHAVLELAPERRQSLLQRTILPGLLDGRADGRVLPEFPDIDLAESLCLLLDLETAAPEVLSTALDRMDLPIERRRALAPLLDAGIRQHAGAPHVRDAGEADARADRYARKLLRIDAAAAGSFREFAAFDLSVDGQTGAAIARLRSDVEKADPLVARMRCLSNLVRLEPNPAAAEGFLRSMLSLLGELERAARWGELASWLAHLRECSEALRPARPDVADAVVAALEAFCTRELATALVDLDDGSDERRALVTTLLSACGGALAPPFVALLDDPAMHGKARTLVRLMCDHAQLLAPGLGAQLGHVGPAASAAIVKVLGCAGAGHETLIAGAFEHGDEQVVRDALRTLARIGNTQAAMVVAAQLRHPSAWVRAAAQEALCRFPPAQVQAYVRDLLGRRDFVRRHPEAAARLLDRVMQIEPAGLRRTLATLVPLRFCFWNPALARVGARARELMKR